MPITKVGRPCRDCKSVVCYCHDTPADAARESTMTADEIRTLRAERDDLRKLYYLEKNVSDDLRKRVEEMGEEIERITKEKSIYETGWLEAEGIVSDLRERADRAEAALRVAVGAVVECTCHPAYSERGLQDPECPAGLFGDIAREGLGLPPRCHYNRAALRQDEGGDE